MRNLNRFCQVLGFLAALSGMHPLAAISQEQSRESAALDNTAAAWSFQLAYQAMPDYRDDVLASGETRPEGNKGYVQFRMVAPLKLGGLNVLPRLTVRLSENKDGEWGFSPTDFFALAVPFGRQSRSCFCHPVDSRITTNNNMQATIPSTAAA